MTHVLAEPVLRSDGVIYLSSPTDFQMADEWYEFARPEHFWFQWRFAALRALLGPARLELPVLEVGCGNGVARQQLEAVYGCAVDGCDVNATALRQAPPGYGRLYFYNVHERRPEWAGRFGTLVLLDTLEHIDTPVPFLESLAFHLRPGGRILINVPAWSWLYSNYDRAAGHVKRYSRPLLEAELAAAGLTLVRSGYWGLSLLPIALLRKWLLAAMPPERTIRVGFEPGSRATAAVLRALLHVECRLWPLPWCGTSLVALAGKER